MDDAEFDRALVSAAFTLAAERGWAQVTAVAAARAAGLPLDRARARVMGRGAILARFGRIADQAALADDGGHGTPRDRLFDAVMRRIDVLQSHRAGVLALRGYLPRDPGLALMLTAATAGSMAWLLEASDIPTTGLRGMLRVQGMLAVWAYVMRAWQSDESEDLAATMAALDRALDRAVQAEGWLRFGRGSADTAAMADDAAMPGTALMPEPMEPASTTGALDEIAGTEDEQLTPPPPPAIDPPVSPPA